MSTFPVIIVMVLYFTSIPIAFALLAAALAYFTFGDVGTPPDLILQKFMLCTITIPLLVVPGLLRLKQTYFHTIMAQQLGQICLPTYQMKEFVLMVTIPLLVK